MFEIPCGRANKQAKNDIEIKLLSVLNNFLLLINNIKKTKGKKISTCDFVRNASEKKK